MCIRFCSKIRRIGITNPTITGGIKMIEAKMLNAALYYVLLAMAGLAGLTYGYLRGLKEGYTKGQTDTKELASIALFVEKSWTTIKPQNKEMN